MMTQTFAGRGRTPRGLHAAALLTLLCFGCTTVRAPASAIAPTVPVRGGTAEPQLELWLESGRQVSPAESEQAAAEARAALRQAVADRQAIEGDAILVVRAQGVSRTRSRRSDQRAAVAGIAVGAVALVAIVVVAIVAGKGSGGGPKLSGVPRVAGGARPAARVVPAIRPSVPARIPAIAPGAHARVVPAAVRRGHASPPGMGVSVYADVQLPLPVEAADAPPPGWDDAHAPGADGTWGAPADAAAAEAFALQQVEELAAVTLWPPLPLDVEKRGFFAKDQLRLELILVDRHSGAVRSAKMVEDEADARDAASVRSVLDRALADPTGWIAYPWAPTASR
jgi:hypothetical protein